jgi:hemerythrin-like domain-containing protein
MHAMKLSVANEPVDLSGGIARLSREDYNALTIVTKIRRAIRYEIDNSLIATFIKKQFDLYLDAHFIEEEVWLFPKLPHTDALRIQAQKQHDHLRYLAWVCANETPVPASLPEEFANYLEEHIRFEERSLFPYIRNARPLYVVKSRSERHISFAIN